ncbi:MAG TPA: hypothetical protein VIC29_19210 [Steroidobacteraceae bacterium]
MAWIELTDTAGNSVGLSVDQMVRVRTPTPGEVEAAAKAVIDLSNGQVQAVRETPNQIVQMLPK